MRRVIISALLLVGCGDDGAGGTADATPSGPDAGPGLLDPPPPAGGQQLTSGFYTVPSGTEKYFCFTFHSPADGERGITKVEPIQGDVVHHVALFETTVNEPEGMFECPQIIDVNWRPIWAGGAGAASLTLPDGVGFKIAPDTQYLVQYHLNNTGDEDITERSAINLTYAPDSSVLQAAGLFALGSFSLAIPAGAIGFQQVHQCLSDRLMNVFAVFPHMHKLGTAITFDVGASEAAAQNVYALDPWIFGEQPMDPLDLQIDVGTFLRATCTWDNTTGVEVTFGESSENEMCFFTIFYYPFTELAGCVN